jgi:flagellar hook-associated protein 2
MASSGITFSGFNNVDFNLVLNSLMQQASQPLTSLQNHQTALRSQITTFGLLGARVSALQNAADDLSDLAGLTTFSASSSDGTTVGINSSTASVAGQYEVVVNELARAQVMASTSSAPDAATTVVASGGTLTIGGKTVTIASDATLQQLADAINNTADVGVHAAVVRASAGAYRLTLTSSLTGAAHAFTVTNALTGGSGVTFGDFDNNGVSGNSPEDNAVQATDASILVNNIAITNASNTFDGAIPDVTFTVYAKTTTPAHLDVSADSSVLKDTLQRFVSAYNDIAKFIGDQRAAGAKGDAAGIGRDPLLRQLSGSLRSALLSAYGSDAMTRLSEVGLEFTQTGTLKLDAARLAEALDTDETNVRNLIGGTTGAFAAVGVLLDEYSQQEGFIASVKTRLTAEIDNMDDQIERLQLRLAQQREALQREFIQADLAMSRLKNQQSSLANFGSGLGLL